VPHPTIGRIVIYRTDGRNGLDYELPAIVTCTLDSHPGDYPDGSHNPLPVPDDDEHVHLTVFSPGGFGTTVMDRGGYEDHAPLTDTEFVGAKRITPGSGSYVEWNVPRGDGPRSWHWPVIEPGFSILEPTTETEQVTPAGGPGSRGSVDDAMHRGLPSVGP
jgi:hypothetical protein